MNPVDLKENKITTLKETTLKARRLIIEMAARSKSAHVGSALSCVDLLVATYFSQMHIVKKDWPNRDIFVLSKGHAAMALYVVLALKGLIEKKSLLGYFQNEGTLPAHLDRFTGDPIEASAGSLGHGFNMALGMAHGYKLRKDKRKIFTLIGDGESQEGSIWEGASFGAKLGLSNVTAMLDFNNLQGYGRPKEICYYEPVCDKWRSFGWEPYEVDGHDFSEILEAFQKPHKGKPKIIIAKTIKGKGVSFMEDELKWHYFIVTEELKEKALKELN